MTEANARPASSGMPPLITGFESTYMPGVGTDVLQGTRHNERFQHDFDLVRSADIRTVRYPASWNYVESEPGLYDWSLLDHKLDALREAGLTPILDLVHHTAISETVFPKGFAEPDFADRLAEFAGLCAERYPWIRNYTIFNEPYLTAQFCGEFGIWFPFLKGEDNFVTVVLNIANGIARSAQVLRANVPDVCLMHPDTCERHTALTVEAGERAAFANIKRFLMDDLLTGRITDNHPLYGFLRRHGASEADLDGFAGQLSPIDIRGLDYYRQSEWEHLTATQSRWAETRAGFAAVARDYIDRFQVPVMLSETNYFGPSADRVAWFRSMRDECRTLVAQDVDLRGFCWFPFVSSTDFQHMLLQNRNDVDPVGIYDIEGDRWERKATGLIDELKIYMADWQG